MDCTIRTVRTPADLATVFDILGAQITPPRTHEDRSYCDLARAFPRDRTLMLVAVDDEGEIVGGALAFRAGAGVTESSDATVRILAVVPNWRGQGLGRRLMERFEAAAVALGVDTVCLGAGPDVRGFYRRLGYDGRSRMRKSLPGSTLTRYGPASDRRRALAELRARRAARQATAAGA
jgi:predicted N-acetyltransferase YhbS